MTQLFSQTERLLTDVAKNPFNKYFTQIIYVYLLANNHAKILRENVKAFHFILYVGLSGIQVLPNLKNIFQKCTLQV
jgi:hypothetical protein